MCATRKTQVYKVGVKVIVRESRFVQTPRDPAPNNMGGVVEG